MRLYRLHLHARLRILRYPASVGSSVGASCRNSSSLKQRGRNEDIIKTSDKDIPKRHYIVLLGAVPMWAFVNRD